MIITIKMVRNQRQYKKQLDTVIIQTNFSPSVLKKVNIIELADINSN